MEDQQFLLILDFFGLSWKGYRKVRRGVKKRLDRYMRELGTRDTEALRLAMQKDPEQRHEVERLLTVSISRFFRDRGLWKTFKENILPSIPDGAGPVKVWSAGCAREGASLGKRWAEQDLQYRSWNCGPRTLTPMPWPEPGRGSIHRAA